ncbi:ATP-binding protein [Caulobacter sp. LjRoot300]
MGLAICKGLVDAMGGRIGVSSKAGQGASFWFEAPAARSTRGTVESDRSAISIPDGMPLSGRR